MPDNLQVSETNFEEIVSFTINSQHYCMSIRTVLEIRGWTTTTILPHAPDFVIGMMNLRGTVLPVIDLSLRLGMGKTEPEARHVIIIAKIQEKVIGFLVDAVSDILTVAPSDLQPTPQVSSQSTNEFIRGVYTIDDSLIRALDVISIVGAKADEL